MRVLAIDPGYGRCGVAVLEKRSGEKLLYSACIETSARKTFPERLLYIAEECAHLIRIHEPEAVALERLYITKNQKTAMQVAEARGAIIAEAARCNVPIFEYTPNEIKVAISGWGRADKKQVVTMLEMLLGVNGKKHDDEYDAIAVGLTHLARAGKTR